MSIEAYLDPYAVQVATYCDEVNQATFREIQERVSNECCFFLMPKVIRSLKSRIEHFARLGHGHHPSMDVTRQLIDIFTECYYKREVSADQLQFLQETNNVALVIVLIVTV